MPDKPFSYQVLEKLHGDAQIVLREYDELMRPLEHEGIKAHLQRKLESLVAELEKLEGLAERHHKEHGKLNAPPRPDDLDSDDGAEPSFDEDSGMRANDDTTNGDDDAVVPAAFNPDVNDE